MKAGEKQPAVAAAEERETSTTEILENELKHQRMEQERRDRRSQISLSPSEAHTPVVKPVNNSMEICCRDEAA